MTRFLKLVRNQNGNWQALPCDSDLAPVTLERDENAPIDPVQLLNALASLLSPDGGIKSVEEVSRLSSLMKKFSKKLVSRCVYCNVLRATKPEILTVFLDESGWNTINSWLQDAKNSNNSPFLFELLQLCKVLPMTVERLKQNNTARLVKSLTKFDNAEVKELSHELVKKWMTIVKGETSASSDSGTDKKKKKKVSVPVEKHKEEPIKDIKKFDKLDKKLKVVLEKDLKIAAENTLKDVVAREAAAKIKGQKRNSKEKESQEIYEDVKIDPEPLVKKAKIVDRPKTVKILNTKFRATGLEEETPLPKPVNKKTSTANKNLVAAGKATGVKRVHPSLSERVSEKKIKPENLIISNESSSHNGGIKLIPPKPRPAHILHESASFMDALVAQPAALPKKKKKVPTNKPSTPPTPPSPTITPPKLQFYKDTLEMDENEESADKKESSDTVSKEKASSPPRVKREDSVESLEVDESPATPVDATTSSVEQSIDDEIAKEAAKGKMEECSSSSDGGPAQLRSILTHGKRPEKKKTVRWLDDSNLKEVFFFEMDETERVNVNHVHNFGDLKSIEMKREREAFEAARRHLGDRMEETIPWWVEPILVDISPALVEPGCNSREREVQLTKQQSTLQEIYFTRDMVPDSPHEPELEIFTPQEARIVPLDDEFNVGTLMDYSSSEMPAPKTALPEILTSLINIPKPRKTVQEQQSQLNIPNQSHNENNRVPPPHQMMNMGPPYDPGDPMPQAGLLGIAPPSHMFASPPGPEMENGPLPGEWRPMEPMGMPPDQYFSRYPTNRPLMIDHMHQPMHSRGDMRPRLLNGPLMMPDMFAPGMAKGPSMPRPSGSNRVRPHIPCRHFLGNGCRFGASCNFLHPGVNGPPL